jgi:hypothetical protein
MRKDIEYAELLKKSFAVVWQHKVIWLFGIVLALMSGHSSVVSNLFGSLPEGVLGSFSSDTADSASGGSGIPDLDNYISAIGPDRLMLIAAMAIVFLIISALVIFFLSTLIHGSLINLVEKAHNGEKPEAKPALGIGWRKALPMIGMRLLLLIPIIAAAVVVSIVVIIIAVAIALLASASTVDSLPRLGVAIAIVLAGLTIIIGIFASIVFFAALALLMEFAQRFIVIGDKNVTDSIRSAWVLLRNNLGTTFVSWLIMFAAQIPYSIVLVILLVILVVPVVLVGIKVSVIAAVLLAIPLLLLMLMPVGYWIAFASSFWTHVFLALQEPDSAESPSNDELSCFEEETSGEASDVFENKQNRVDDAGYEHI